MLPRPTTVMEIGTSQMVVKLNTRLREQWHFTEVETMPEMSIYYVLITQFCLQVESSVVRLKMPLVEIKHFVSISATQPVSTLLMV